MGQWKTVLVFGGLGRPTEPDPTCPGYVQISEDAIEAGNVAGDALGVCYETGGDEDWHGYLVTDEETPGPLDVAALLAGEDTEATERMRLCQRAWLDLCEAMHEAGVELPSGRLLLVMDYERA